MKLDIHDIKRVRKITSARLIDCVAALKKNSNDVKKSVSYLRRQYKLLNNSILTRFIEQGFLSFTINDYFASLIDLNCQSDFVMKNLRFFYLSRQIFYGVSNFFFSTLKRNLKTNHICNISKLMLHNSRIIGENIILRRSQQILFGSSNVLYYLHNKITVNKSKILVIIILDGIMNIKNKHFIHYLLMHIAASKVSLLKFQDINKASFLDINNSLFNRSNKNIYIMENVFKTLLYRFIEQHVLIEQIFIITINTKIKYLFSNLSSSFRFNIVYCTKFMSGII